MISTQFLHDVATYTDGRIAKVVLNGSVVITDFEVKQVTDNKLALNYIVRSSSVSTITLIELKDATDNIISSNAVNVPIASDTLMLQTVEVKEV